MNWIVFASSTTAGRLKRLAQSAGLTAVKIAQAPKTISQNGCTYALTCPASVLPEVLELATTYGINHGYIYKEQIRPNGERYFERLY